MRVVDARVGRQIGSGGEAVSDSRVKVLMFAEAVTLAHVARPVALARQLDPARFDVTVACDPRYAAFAAGATWTRVDLDSIPSAQFNRALAKGSPVYDSATLARYANDDLRLIGQVQPDVVVGDFRLSLSASARVAKVPYLTIANAYWSPDYARPFPLPVLPLTRLLPLPVARILFDTFRPMAFAQHCVPLNGLRQKHGLPLLGRDLRRVYTDADFHLVPDVEALYPLPSQPSRRKFLGPLTWSPSVGLPSWWDEPVPAGHRTIYLTLGSSGSAGVLQQVLSALDGLPLRVMASAAGTANDLRVPTNARVAPYLPGDEATRRADLVICNGGSLTTQQALLLGVPVLGLASNMDQFFNMGPLVDAGAALVLREDRLDARALRDACLSLLDSESARDAARRLAPIHQPSVPVAVAFEQAVSRVRSGRA